MDKLDRNIRMIRFLILAFVMFAVCDIMGLMFVAADAETPAFRRMICWGIALATAALIFFCFRKIKKPGPKIATALSGYLLYLALLYICRFFSTGGADTIGYKTGMAIVPVIGILWCTYVPKGYLWFSDRVHNLSENEALSNALFIISQLALIAVCLLIVWGGYRLRGVMTGIGESIQQFVQAEIEENNPNSDHREPYRKYDQIFNDLQDMQIQAAIQNGLSASATAATVESNPKLKKIESNKLYKIDKLTHSVPYLVPKAAKLVEDMGQAFQDSLWNRGYSRNHRFIVTSVLRTEESVKQLRKSNTNASENSCHCYGTTIDIAYYRYDTPETGRVADAEKLRQVLMQVAYDMRNSGRCYVKYEKKQSCLHITVR